MDTPSVISKTICVSHKLNDKWVLYHHSPSDKDWSLAGYTILMDGIDSVEAVISVNKALTEKIVKYSMLFFMRSGISPIWEDVQNKKGGCFSYKVVNKNVVLVWRQMMYLVAGESLGLDTYNSSINGITISPKKNFCILKIWMKDTFHKNPDYITTIANLTKHGVMFKLHGEK